MCARVIVTGARASRKSRIVSGRIDGGLHYEGMRALKLSVVARFRVSETS